MCEYVQFQEPGTGGVPSPWELAAAIHDEGVRQGLWDAAAHLVATGCGEGWLLQPYLRDFATSEYRCRCGLSGRRTAAAARCGY